MPKGVFPRSAEHCKNIGLANRGRYYSPETRKKISESNKGKKRSLESRKKMSIAHKGRVCSEETKRKISESQMGSKNPFYGKTHSLESRKKMSHKLTKEHKEKLIRSNLGKKRSKEFCDNRSGKGNPHWLGGKSFEPYGIEFNDRLKVWIRRRDRFRCQECFRHQDELKRKLSVHHIDFDKKNNAPENLITLCGVCHAQTQYNREQWTRYYQRQMRWSDGQAS